MFKDPAKPFRTMSVYCSKKVKKKRKVLSRKHHMFAKQPGKVLFKRFKTKHDQDGLRSLMQNSQIPTIDELMA